MTQLVFLDLSAVFDTASRCPSGLSFWGWDCGTPLCGGSGPFIYNNGFLKLTFIQFKLLSTLLVIGLHPVLSFLLQCSPLLQRVMITLVLGILLLRSCVSTGKCRIQANVMPKDFFSKLDKEGCNSDPGCTEIDELSKWCLEHYHTGGRRTSSRRYILMR